jgi:hypothetical protein
MLVNFRRFSSVARSVKRKSSIAASHFSTFFEFSHGILHSDFDAENLALLREKHQKRQPVPDWGDSDRDAGKLVPAMNRTSWLSTETDPSGGVSASG